MSLITGCPACGTLFRVVPDQLKISEGWVRCGHCQEVFDATAHFQEEAQEAAEDSAVAQAPAEEAAVEAPAEVALADEPVVPIAAAPVRAPVDAEHPDVELIEVENPY